MGETIASSDAKQSRAVAEAARADRWAKESFLRQLFLGRLRLDLVDPFPQPTPADVKKAAPFLAALHALLERVDPDAIDRDGAIPQQVLAGLRAIGAFGIKIPEEHGGLGLSLSSYLEAMRMVASRCGNLAALLSAHQSIGLPQPLMMFGTPEQQRRWLPRLARGAISAFALTEEGAGSDPASMKTTATQQPDGSWLLEGGKIWCTNGTVAELFVVMARTPDVKGKRQITAFVIEAGAPGFEVVQRCTFMGLRALENAVLRFRAVRVPAENVLGGVGRGLKLALATLNIGRLAVPASCAGAAASLLQATRKWAAQRAQWGVRIGEHEAIGHKISAMAADVFAMESVSRLAGQLAATSDVRLEAALAKLWNAQTAWRIADDALQIRGGRGYETAASQAARGEEPVAIERMVRDLRVNRIFEGSAEILHLFVSREALDHHLSCAFDVINPDATLGERLRALERSARFYPRWYAGSFVAQQEGLERFGALAPHARWLEQAVRQLGRAIFHAMVRYGPALEHRQAILFRAVDIGAELFAAAATLSRARALEGSGHAEVPLLADLFCTRARARVEQLFRELFDPADARWSRLALATLDGRLAWLEEGALGFTPPRYTTLSTNHHAQPAAAPH